MSLARAGGLTTLILAILITSVLIAFASARSTFDTGDIVERIVYFFPVSLIGIAPITMLVFPLMHRLMGANGPVRPRTFAAVGAVLGAVITGYVLIRFRGALFPSIPVSFIAIPVLTIIGTLAGLIGGFMFEVLARKRNTA